MTNLVLSLPFLAILTAVRALHGDDDQWQVNNQTLKAYYINMRDNPFRREAMEQQLKAVSLPAVRFEAITGTEVEKGYYDDKYVLRQGRDPRLAEQFPDKTHAANNVVACFCSHIELMQKVQQELEPDQLALIMEDDVLIPVDWKSRLEDALSRAPKDWSLLKISGWGANRAHDLVETPSLANKVLGVLEYLVWPLTHGGRLQSAWYAMTKPFVVPQYRGSSPEFFYAGAGGYLLNASTIPLVLKHLRSQPIGDTDAMFLSDGKGEYRAFEVWPHVLDLAPWHHTSGIHLQKSPAKEVVDAKFPLQPQPEDVGKKEASIGARGEVRRTHKHTDRAHRHPVQNSIVRSESKRTEDVSAIVGQGYKE
eukprot:gnl/TRDRNA2_/TRDRNA2_153066_c1_seq2.p1 gnl/TRDRNA2_/TRDRNA2_153066_c1~~gnl/TRDRNA2_/TRDRNA2_153066_c1_seq2.p1  ORF type:complete len:365 (-),score=60.67 gnl/TRDRNA2_/TRDRNA2_153066_c1_seq2:54-1148(-)